MNVKVRIWFWDQSPPGRLAFGLGNYLKRILKLLAVSAGIPDLTHQCFAAHLCYTLRW